MLKKAGNIVIILLLLVATGGMPVTRHYCGLVQKSVSFFTTPKSCCGDSCSRCHNVFKFTKVNDDFEAGTDLTSLSLTDIVISQSVYYIDLFDILNIPRVSDFVNQRAASSYRAGHAPATLGNFRC
jgi:hypothetical protein